MISEQQISQIVADAVHGLMGQWLVDTLVVTGVLMALVLVLRRPVARYFGAQLAYALWLIPLARLFNPPLIETIEHPADGLRIDIPRDPGIFVSQDMLMTVPDSVPRVTPSEGLTAAMVQDADWFAIALILWLGGAALFLVIQLATYLQNRRELLNEAIAQASVGNIRVIEVAGIAGPFAFGLWPQYIALPAGFAQAYDPIERELALAHECAHHRGGDLWANFAGLLLLSLHWFNPVAWLAWRAFRFDQEAACDARVLRHRDVTERSAYARAIAKAATGQTLVFASPLNRRLNIIERLKFMQRKDVPMARQWLGIALIAGGLIVAMPMTATMSYAIAPPTAPQMPLASPRPSAPSQDSQIPELAETPEFLGAWQPASKPEAEPYPPVLPSVPKQSDAPALRDDMDDRGLAEPVFGNGPDIFTVKRDGRDVSLRFNSPADRATLAARLAAVLAARAAIDSDRSSAKADHVIALGKGHSLRISTSSCKGKPASAPFVIQTEMRGKTVVRQKILSCGVTVFEKGISEAFSNMAKARSAADAAAAGISENPDFLQAERAQALRDLDQAIAELRTELDAVRKELRAALADRN